jgi:hypothetical protein
VDTLRGLYESADFQENELRMGFERVWISLDLKNELRAESWTIPGASTEDSLTLALAKFQSWIERVLAAG